VRKALSSLTFGNILQLIGMFVLALLFVSGGNLKANANEKKIVVVEEAVAEHSIQLEALRDVDAGNQNEVKNIKGDLVYHTDILEAVAKELKVALPIRRPAE